MANRQNPLFWSFPLGTWFGVRVRVSWFVPLVALWLAVDFGWHYGGVLFGIFFASVLLHEFGHILAARSMNGSGDEILLWPLGGLAFVDRRSSPKEQFVTAAGGPIVHLVICLLCLPAILSADYGWKVLHPLQLPIATDDFGRSGWLVDVQTLCFSVNWMLLLVNLVPAYPLDGGQMARTWLATRFNAATAREISVRVAVAAAIVLAVAAAFFFKSVMLLGIAFLIALLALQESFEMQAGDSFEDSFMGYDFSQGYTSLERSGDTHPKTRRGVLTRWLESRRLARQRRHEELQQQIDEQLDSLLAKVHDHGIGALSASERRLLERASDRYRSKGKDRS